MANSNRLGDKSVASIELDTSITIIASIPFSSFGISFFLKSCGRAKAIIRNVAAIAPAIEKAAASFSSRDDIGKAIILFTDGENHDSDAVAAAKKAAESGIKVFAVTVGSTEGDRIPIEGGYLRDENGQEVVSRANPQLCKSIAEAGEGAAFVGEKCFHYCSYHP